MPNRQSRIAANPAPVLLAALAFALGCSASTSPSSGVQCGPGTVLEGTLCVAHDSGTTKGDSSVPIDGSPTPDTSTPVSDSAKPDSVVVDTSPSGGGDPCPSKVIDVNCSTTCGGDKSKCSLVTCGSTTSDPALQITNYSQLPFILRTPDKPGVDPKCAKCDGALPGLYAMAVSISFPYALRPIRVTVGAPWMIGGFNRYYPHCAFDGKSGCFALKSYRSDLVIFTTDPNAPSRNVVIDMEPASDASVPACE